MLSREGCRAMTESRRAAGDEPLVSVIIPTFNRWPMVCESIDSAMAQDYPNFEVIVVDDGSSDETEEELPGRYVDRVRYIRQANQGPSVARNTGIEAAQGEYIAFLDSDDLWLPGKTRAQVAVLEQDPKYAAAYGICLLADADGTPTGEVLGNTARGWSGDNFAGVLRLNHIQTSTVMVRRDVLVGTVGLFDEQMLSGQDVDMWPRITMQHLVAFVRRPVALYRVHRGQWSDYVVRCGHRLRGSQDMLQKLLTDLPPERECMRPGITGRLVACRLRLAELEHQDEGWPGTMAAVRAIIGEETEAIHTFYPHEAMAHIVCARVGGDEAEARREDVVRLLDSLEAPAGVRRRWIGMFHCAMSRQLLMDRRTAEGVASALRVALVSPGTFARHLLPALALAPGWALRNLRRRVLGGRAAGLSNAEGGGTA